MSETDMKPRHRRVYSPISEPPRSPKSLILVSRSNFIKATENIRPISPTMESSNVECHDLLLSDSDENWTLRMDDDEEVGDETKKITDFVRESFKKEGKALKS